MQKNCLSEPRGAALAAAALALGLWSASGCAGKTSDDPETAGTGGNSVGGSGGTSTAGSGGTSTAGGTAGTGGAGSVLTCVTPEDCTWTEIPNEILLPTDCICLLGCPHLLVNRTTAERRAAQHASLCDPWTDGQGNPCPIDECLIPPTPDCIDSVCTSEPWY